MNILIGLLGFVFFKANGAVAQGRTKNLRTRLFHSLAPSRPDGRLERLKRERTTAGVARGFCAYAVTLLRALVVIEFFTAQRRT